MSQATTAPPLRPVPPLPPGPSHPSMQGTVFPVLLAVSFCHLLNDMIQSLLPAIYPILKGTYGLSFTQIGTITLAFQLTASLLQPVVGLYTDRRPVPFSLPVGMACSLVGLLLLSVAGSYGWLLIAASLVGLGSSVFHPESARVARMASGGRFGLAQSVFQVGGNAGQALGPLMAAFIVVPFGQPSIAWFSAAALLGMAVLSGVSRWYAARSGTKAVSTTAGSGLSRRQIGLTVAVLVALLFSKFFYVASLNTYYTFYLIHTFGVSVQASQLLLFLFLGAFALGVLAGGPIGDRVGRKWVIWVSILGVLPFTMALPYANLPWTAVLTVIIGLVLASASSTIIVYAQELIPGKVGLINGLFFGLAFGLGGLGAAVLGWLIDQTSITFVYRLCAYLPALGLLTVFLPDIERRRT